MAAARRRETGGTVVIRRAVVVPENVRERRGRRGTGRRAQAAAPTSFDVAEAWDALERAAKVLERAKDARARLTSLERIYRALTWLLSEGRAPTMLRGALHAAGNLVHVAGSVLAAEGRLPGGLWAKAAHHLGANLSRYVASAKARPRTNPGGPSTRSRVAYRVTHWGHGGKKGGRVLEFAEPAGDIAEIGELLAVVYKTTKAGDPPRSTYVHEFGPKARPRLCFNVESKRLLIGGGAARMRTRGITG